MVIWGLILARNGRLSLMRRILLISLSLAMIIVGVSCSKEADKGGVFTYSKYDWQEQSAKQFLGSEEAQNTILFIFDYACPWCKKWMNELLPEVKIKFLDNGKARYSSQAVVLLSQESLNLAQVDYAVEKLSPEHYFKLQEMFSSEAGIDGWGSIEYINTRLINVGLSPKLLEDSSLSKMTDRVRLTREFTKQRDLQSVPSIYINGIKMSDPFNLQEMEDILQGNIKEGDTFHLPLTD
jgi:hypothetical protein